MANGGGLVVLRAPPPESRVLPRPLPESAAQALHHAFVLARENPAAFSYPWVDRHTNEVVIDVTAEAATVATKLHASNVVSAAHRIRSVKRSFADLERIRDDVINFTNGGDPVLAPILSMESDGENNRVIITVNALSDELLARLEKRYGTEAIAVRYDPAAELAQLQSREADTSPFFGGANVGGCTSGFSWYWGSISYMLTAGHCFPFGSADVRTPRMHMGFIHQGSRENYNVDVGSVPFLGQWWYSGDLALVEIPPGKSSAGRIFRTASGSWPVKEMWSRITAVGDQYCTGGRVSGELCGWTVTCAQCDFRHFNSSGPINRWTRYITHGSKRGHCTKPGDSGGPIYTLRSDGGVYAKGIHNYGYGGGSDYYGGIFDPCEQGFTDIWSVYWAFGGALRTQ